jgi:hypothetical protein
VGSAMQREITEQALDLTLQASHFKKSLWSFHSFLLTMRSPASIACRSIAS